MSESNYDVIIAGASFAGLAVARRIKNGKVLLIDSKPIGTDLKSACGVPFFMLSELELEDCVKQIHRKIVLHTSRGNLVYNLATPFCVIDGEKFCQKLFEKGKAEFLKASVLGFDGQILKTDKGDFQAKILVDASGPNSVLAGSKNKDCSFGLETVVPYQDDGLHFWYEPKIFPKGIFWLFPQGKTSRVGIGSYRGETNLLSLLDEFLSRFGLKRGVVHGGYFPHCLDRKSVV